VEALMGERRLRSWRLRKPTDGEIAEAALEGSGPLVIVIEQGPNHYTDWSDTERELLCDLAEFSQHRGISSEKASRAARAVKGGTPKQRLKVELAMITINRWRR
jgi:hypothetical protein